jgi:flagellar biosynthesis/type III secretory pathway protein FliH
MRTPFEKWLHALKFGEMLYGERGSSIPDELRQEEGIEMALDAMRRASASEEVREMIEFRRKAEHDEATRLEQARNEGVDQGVKKGVEQGMKEGMEQGTAKGRREALIATARKMREAGMDEETIRTITGLAPGDID